VSKMEEVLERTTQSADERLLDGTRHFVGPRLAALAREHMDLATALAVSSVYSLLGQGPELLLYGVG
jgi:hypothetical protein